MNDFGPNKFYKAGEPFIVKYVDFQATRLIDAKEQFHPSIKIGDAKKMAQESGLDLVCFNLPQNGTLALCKIVDYGKWRYYNEKQKKKQNHNSKEPKEMQFTPDIADHDIEYKVKHINGFLDEGHDVTLIMTLKGRQKAHFALAEEKMNKIAVMCTSGKEAGRKKHGGGIMIRLSKNHVESVVNKNNVASEVKVEEIKGETNTGTIR